MFSKNLTGWKYAMLESVDQNDGVIDDEEFGNIVLFPTFKIRAKFKVLTLDEFLVALAMQNV